MAPLGSEVAATKHLWYRTGDWITAVPVSEGPRCGRHRPGAEAVPGTGVAVADVERHIADVRPDVRSLWRALPTGRRRDQP